MTAPCCDLHREPCCDPDDCGPCCEGCPTCPTYKRMDGRQLRHAAGILRRRSQRPDGFLLDVLCRVLERFAARLEDGSR